MLKGAREVLVEAGGRNVGPKPVRSENRKGELARKATRHSTWKYVPLDEACVKVLDRLNEGLRDRPYTEV